MVADKCLHCNKGIRKTGDFSGAFYPVDRKLGDKEGEEDEAKVHLECFEAFQAKLAEENEERAAATAETTTDTATDLAADTAVVGAVADTAVADTATETADDTAKVDAVSDTAAGTTVNDTAAAEPAAGAAMA